MLFTCAESQKEQATLTPQAIAYILVGLTCIRAVVLDSRFLSVSCPAVGICNIDVIELS